MDKFKLKRKDLVEQIKTELRTSEIKEERFKLRIEYVLSLVPCRKSINCSYSYSETEGYTLDKESVYNVPWKTLLDNFSLINKHGEVSLVEIYQIKTKVFVEHTDCYGIESFWYFRL